MGIARGIEQRSGDSRSSRPCAAQSRSRMRRCSAFIWPRPIPICGPFRGPFRALSPASRGAKSPPWPDTSKDSIRDGSSGGAHCRTPLLRRIVRSAHPRTSSKRRTGCWPSMRSCSNCPLPRWWSKPARRPRFSRRTPFLANHLERRDAGIGGAANKPCFPVPSWASRIPFIIRPIPAGHSATPSDNTRLASFLDLFAPPPPPKRTEDLHLARLVGSAREITACAAAWNGPQSPVLLEGAGCLAARREAALNSHPAVLHFATHVLESRQGFRSGLIVLSIADGGRSEVLTSAEIATWHLDGRWLRSAAAVPGPPRRSPPQG